MRLKPPELAPMACALAPFPLRLQPGISATRPPPHRGRFHPRCCLDSDLRIAFTASSAGGHIYPAIAIADSLKALHPAARILFIGTAAGLESATAASSGYDFASVPPAPLNLLLPFRLLQSLFASWSLLRTFRPHIVVSTGGTVALPVSLAAILLSKLVIQEQNAVPTLTNRILDRFAEKVFLSFPSSARYFENAVVYGNPVRPSLLHKGLSKAAARKHFFDCEVSGKAEVLLVLAGLSDGDAINISVLNMYFDMLSEHKNRFIIWQTGAQEYNEMESLVKNHRRLLLTPFLQAMDLAYAAADVVVSRAGAMTCTEILTTGKPAILIPLPDGVDDHQIKNAYIMADIAASKVLEEDELDSSSLETAINEVLGDEALMAGMSDKALRVAKPNAATEIAECILSLAKLSSSK